MMSSRSTSLTGKRNYYDTYERKENLMDRFVISDSKHWAKAGSVMRALIGKKAAL